MNDRQAIIDSIADRISDITSEARRKPEEPQRSPSKKKEQEAIAYYASDTNRYYLKNARGQWIKYDVTSLRRYLDRVIFRHVTKKEGKDEHIDDFIVTLQQKSDVTLGIPLAGYPIGVHEICNERVLVTKEANYIRPRAGEWPNLRRIIDTLLPEQQPYLYGWLKCALLALRAGPPFRPGQLMAIAGPSDCGKSFLQNMFTLIFGGRCADPFEFMMGETHFCSELFYAEHLIIEDKAASSNIADRVHFGSRIKTILVNETQKFHRKLSEPLTVSPFWRGSLTLNDDPESLLVMPPIKEDLVDKIILLKASRADFPVKDDDLVKRRAFWEACVAELPAFVSFLLAWKVPEHQKDKRFGVRAWQHPDLLELLAELAPESSLLALIDELLPFDIDQNDFVGSSAKLHSLLIEKDKLHRVEKIVKTPVWLGVYLSRLAKNFKNRVIVENRHSGKASWRITSPMKPVTESPMED